MNNPWFQLVASVIAMVMIANLQYAWTLFVQPIQKATAWKLSDIQWAFTLFILLQTWVQPMDGWLIDRMGPRIFITAAGVLCGVGWGALAYATSLPQLYFFYGLAGIGAAFVYSGSIGSALKWFPNRRGLAAGIIAAGFGGGTALFIPFISYMIRAQSYRTAFLVTGAFQGLVIAIVAQFLRHPGPEFAKANPAIAGVKTRVRKNTENFTTGEMLKSPHFYLLYIMFVAMATGGLLVTAQAGPMAAVWGVSAAAAVSLSPLGNAASRIGWGWGSDRIGRETAMGIAFILQAVCLAALGTMGRTSGAMFTVTVVLVFLTWGEVFSLFPSTCGDYFGSRHATSNYGFLYSAKGVASIPAGGVAAMLYEGIGDWTPVLYGCAVLAMLSGLIAFGLRSMPLPRKASLAVREAVLKET